MFYLGISAFYHDSSVALIDEEGNFVDFKKEEWLSRIKGDKTFPRLALQELINSFNLSEENIKSITFYEKPVRSWISVLKHSVKNNPISNDLTRNYFKNAWNSSMRFQMDISKYIKIKKIPLLYSDHHLSHTLSALHYYNNFPCVSVVVDGYGDKYCTSIHHVKSDKEIINLWNSEYPNSLGLFYSAITDFLGFSINEGEYKVMGLASFGQPKFFEKLKKTIKFEDNKLITDTKYYDYVRRIDRSFSDLLTELFETEPRLPNVSLKIGEKKFQVYADIAASAQKVLEELLFSIFQYAYNLTKEKKFLFSGGVAMNSAAVRKCSKLKFIDQLNISPSPGDSGAAIGASYFGLLNERKKKIDNFVSKNNIKNNLFPGKFKPKDNFLEFGFDKIADANTSLNETSKLIAKNEIIATCYGNIETGPRALGHRSLICNAHSSELVKKLNTEIKKRSLFRPTAPAILKEYAEKYFYLENSLMNCYMHMAATAIPKAEVFENIRGVVHIDNTTRIQICNETQLLGKILSNLIKFDIYLIANTSFNISSDPMVYDEIDAVVALHKMKIKYLLTENGLFRKKFEIRV
jgi:carbamoyltransferase